MPRSTDSKGLKIEFLERGDWRKPKMMKKRVVPAGKLRHLARSVSTVAESKVSVEETVRMAPQCWKD